MNTPPRCASLCHPPSLRTSPCLDDYWTPTDAGGHKTHSTTTVHVLLEAHGRRRRGGTTLSRPVHDKRSLRHDRKRIEGERQAAVAIVVCTYFVLLHTYARMYLSTIVPIDQPIYFVFVLGRAKVSPGKLCTYDHGVSFFWFRVAFTNENQHAVLVRGGQCVRRSKKRGDSVPCCFTSAPGHALRRGFGAPPITHPGTHCTPFHGPKTESMYVMPGTPHTLYCTCCRRAT